MDQIKIGNFIKVLRREKGLTQEQLAERFGVARRTVSRWETGSNMPDLDILMEMSDFYAVDLRELLDGERKGEKMNKELEETVMKVADYSNDEKLKLMQSMHWLFIAGLIAAIVYTVLVFTGHSLNFWGGLCSGITSGMMVVGVFITSKNAAKIRAFKLRLLGKSEIRKCESLVLSN